MAAIELNDLDRRIWDEELAGFVPQRVFDVHTHIYRWEFYTAPDKEQSSYRQFVSKPFEEASWRLLDECDHLLMPDRQVSRLAFPFPFAEHCDFAASNQFVAEQVAVDSPSGSLMLVRPEMTAGDIVAAVRKYCFLGLKPYRFYSQTGDAVNCRLTDFLPEHQIEVAHELGLLIMMHLSRADAIGDDQNLADLHRLTASYPNAKWILAHCARSYSAWPIERAGKRLSELSNVWFDTSSVCEADAIEALIRSVGPDRVMYGSDDVPVGVLRGKYIAFGYGWAYLSPTNHQLNLTHCDSRMTFTRYEQLRAMRQAALRRGLSNEQIRAMFFDTAADLVATTRSAL
ncbi:MAG: amidohydrolase family protein [Planctomycetaceae bacterium]|nr:amidohydrolase family protein [Planctomycetales bacterium]MCB9937287.1 amidohydrolase family protein [Planctomycetaceae bacterium]